MMALDKIGLKGLHMRTGFQITTYQCLRAFRSKG